MYFNESIPNCVPEYYRSLQEEQDCQYDLAMQRYKANQRKLDAAAEAGLPILRFGGYNRCWECLHADHDTVTNDDDDICRVICHNPACRCHQARGRSE